MFLVKIALQYAFFSTLIGFLWMIMTPEINLASFLLGFVLGYGFLVAMRGKRGINIQLMRLPSQMAWTVAYAVNLNFEIIFSGLDMALRIVGLRPIRSGILKMKVGDQRPGVNALTAHAIGITSGQLVVDFDHKTHNHMYIHCIDIETSIETLEADQRRRLAFYRRIIGDDMA